MKDNDRQVQILLPMSISETDINGSLRTVPIVNSIDNSIRELKNNLCP